MKFKFIFEQSSKFRVEKMCAVLSVSRSGYYTWRIRPKSRRAQANEMLLVAIREAFNANRCVYGSPRITKELRAQNILCGENRVAGLMASNDIVAKTKRRFKVTTNSKHKLPVAANLVKQNFTASKPGRLWTSDITYIWTLEGWLYLAVVLDVFSRRIIGWMTSARINQQLVVEALKQAVFQGNVSPGIIFHSDRGSQYASEDVKEQLKQHKMIQSMSAKGNCYDNAITESFFSTLKKEHVYFEKFQTRQQAHSSLFDYIEVFYNRQRRHSANGFLSPVEYEKSESNLESSYAIIS